jgi:hypothetical protein
MVNRRHLIPLLVVVVTLGQLFPVWAADSAIIQVSTDEIYLTAGQEDDFRILLKNIGDYKVFDVEAFLTSTTSGLSILSGSHMVFSEIDKGKTKHYEPLLYVDPSLSLGSYTLTLTLVYRRFGAAQDTTITVPVALMVSEGYVPKVKYTSEQSDIRLKSGTESQVRYSFVNNWGQPLYGLEFSFTSTSGYMSILEGVNYSVDTLNSSESVTLAPTISVLEGTPLGVYTVTATATYRDGDGNRYHQVFSLPLNLDEAAIARNTVVTVASEEVLQQSVRPGDVFDVQIQVDCSGASAYEMMSSLSFAASSGISPLSPTTTALGDLEPGETATVSYRLLAGGSVYAGQYPVTVTLTYTDSKGAAGSLTETVTIMVDALIDFELLDEAAAVVYAGEQYEMEADLLLVGTDSVQFVSVQMLEDDTFNRVQGSTEYIGAVDPDSPIPFDIDYRVADDAEPGIHDMTLVVQYRDHLNRVHEEALEYTVTVGEGANPSTDTEQERGGIFGWLSRLFG